ncbi:MAG: hypothetical protein ACFB21_05710 [Opitutales bacterium]
MLRRANRKGVRPCFEARCPHCRDEVVFEIYEAFPGTRWIVLSSMIIGLFAFMIPPKRVLGCQRCGFQKNVDAQSWPLLVDLAEQYRKTHALEMAPEAFLDALFRAPVPELRAILDKRPDWSCPQCGEANPPTFQTCFTCGYANPEIPDEAVADLNLPDVGGREPWE